MSENKNLLQEFKELKEKAQKENLNGIKINTEIENAKNNLDKLLAEAQQTWGKTSIEELEKELQLLTEQNESIVEKIKTRVLLAEKENFEKKKLIEDIKNGNYEK